MRVMVASSQSSILEDAAISALDRFIGGIASSIVISRKLACGDIGKKWAKLRRIEVTAGGADMLVAIWDMKSPDIRALLARAAKKRIPFIVIPEESLATVSVL